MRKYRLTITLNKRQNSPQRATVAPNTQFLLSVFSSNGPLGLKIRRRDIKISTIKKARSSGTTSQILCCGLLLLTKPCIEFYYCFFCVDDAFNDDNTITPITGFHMIRSNYFIKFPKHISYFLFAFHFKVIYNESGRRFLFTATNYIVKS